MPKRYKTKKFHNNNIHEVLNEFWEKSNPKSYECFNIDGYIVIKSNVNEKIGNVSVSTVKKTKNHFEDIPKELNGEFKRLKKEYNLTLAQIDKLKKELKKEEFEKSSIKNQINHLNKKAAILSNEKLKKKIKSNFNKGYEKIFDCLNSELNNLDKDDRKEIIESLKKLNEFIIDTIESLSG